MGQSAHKLKGSSLNVGAVALAEICRQLEVKGRNNDLAGYDQILEDLKNIYDQTARMLTNL